MDGELTLDALLFFDARPRALPVYAAFHRAMAERWPEAEMQVKKTQINYVNRYLFACVSLPRKKRGEGILVSLGLGRRESSPRVAAAVEPYPGRWTNHIPVRTQEEVDGELMAWVEEAYQVAAAKGRGR